MEEGNIKEVEFDEIGHRYFYRGHELRGITSIIGKKLNLYFPKTPAVLKKRDEGSVVHKEVQDWIEKGVTPKKEASNWIVEYLENFLKELNVGRAYKFQSELLVSDFDTTASAIDVVLHVPEGSYIFDIKTGAFKRQYCTMQLNAYRVLFTHNYGRKILGMKVIGTKTKKEYPILETPDEETIELLKQNRL